MCVRTEVRGQPEEVGSLLPLCGFWGLNSSLQSRGQSLFLLNHPVRPRTLLSISNSFLKIYLYFSSCVCAWLYNVAIGIRGDLRWSEPANSLGDGVTVSCEQPDDMGAGNQALLSKGLCSWALRKLSSPCPLYIMLGGEKVKCTHYYKIDVNITQNFYCCLLVFETGKAL